MKRRARFEKSGMLAFYAAHLGFFFDCDDAPEAKDFELSGDVAIVTIEGPLTQHAEWFWDSYDAIKERVAAACASAATTVVLKIDSPGGVVAGCFETARDIRAMADASGKRLVSYADGIAASAGYALACAADQVCLPASAFVGSVGVISALYDQTEANAKWGIRVEVIASGAKKAIGNPNRAIDEAAVTEVQAQVDETAQLFFDHVAGSRPETAAQVKTLEAGVFMGKSAINAGLADTVCTFAELLASLAGDEKTKEPSGTASQERKMGWKDDMQKAADDGDEEAKKALAALDEEEESDDDKKKKEEDAAAAKKKADAEESDEKEKKDEKEAKASASALKMLGEHDRKIASLVAVAEEKERADLLAARADLTPSQLKLLREQPLAQMKATLAVLEPPAVDPAAASKVTPTRGATNGSPVGTTEEVDFIDNAMGFKKAGAGVENKGNKLLLGSMSPAAAKARLAELEKGNV